MTSKAELLDFFEKNRLLKRHFFDNLARTIFELYFLVNNDSHMEVRDQILPDYHLTPTDYFYVQSVFVCMTSRTELGQVLEAAKFVVSHRQLSIDCNL